VGNDGFGSLELNAFALALPVRAGDAR
jgi:hypothetical protein